MVITFKNRHGAKKLGLYYQNCPFWQIWHVWTHLKVNKSSKNFDSILEVVLIFKNSHGAKKLGLYGHFDAFWCVLMRFDAFWCILTRLTVKKWSNNFDLLLEVAFIFKNRLGAKISGQSEHSNLRYGQNGAIDGANDGARWCRGVPVWSERVICHFRHLSWGPS